MESEDIFLLIVTTLVYVTFIFQFLAAAYLGLVAEHIPASVLAVSMTGLGLGLFWFLIGCIALTVVTYTSEYWASWVSNCGWKSLTLPPILCYMRSSVL